MLLEQIDELTARRATFSVETTLAGRTYVRRLEKMKASGYRVVFFFLWLPSADAAIARVESRVKQGGHAVPTDDVRRRYYAGLRNFFGIYRPLADDWWLYDASGLPPRIVAAEKNGRLAVTDKTSFRRIEHQVNRDREEV